MQCTWINCQSCHSLERLSKEEALRSVIWTRRHVIDIKNACVTSRVLAILLHSLPALAMLPQNQALDQRGTASSNQM